MSRLRQHTIVQTFFLWTELSAALVKECKSDVVEDYLTDWHGNQDDWPGDGHIGKKLNIVSYLAALEKKYEDRLAAGLYADIDMDIDADHDFSIVTVDQLDDKAELILLRAMVKILGDHAGGFHIKYNWD